MEPWVVTGRNMPSADIDIDIDETLVRSLLVEQHPDLSELALTPLAFGWDNVIFRLGDELTVRLPRRGAAAGLVENEQRWLPGLARVLPLPVPEPVRTGRPAEGYPWSWTVGRWIAGTVAADTPLSDPGREAHLLGRFVAALHRPAPPDAPMNPFRGHPVAQLTKRFEHNVAQLSGIDADRVRDAWGTVSVADEWRGPPLWLHGDLHAANILVSDGRVSGVIDFGDITAGDPATDLAVAWMLFEEPARDRFRRSADSSDPDGAHSGDDDATWQRAAAWALHFAVMFLLHSADNPRLHRMGDSLLTRVLDDVGGWT